MTPSQFLARRSQLLAVLSLHSSFSYLQQHKLAVGLALTSIKTSTPTRAEVVAVAADYYRRWVAALSESQLRALADQKGRLFMTITLSPRNALVDKCWTASGSREFEITVSPDVPEVLVLLPRGTVLSEAQLIALVECGLTGFYVFDDVMVVDMYQLLETEAALLQVLGLQSERACFFNITTEQAKLDQRILSGITHDGE